MKRNKSQCGDRRSGVSMIEVILITGTILLLALIFGPRLESGGRSQAKGNAAKIEMHSIKAALQDFQLHAGRFPTSAEGLQSLVERPSILSPQEWVGPYFVRAIVPKDTFGVEYKYVFPSEHGNDYDLDSAGPDKQFGTADDISLFEDGPTAAR